MASRGKSKQISFREKVDAADRIERAAAAEDMLVADFVRRLVRYAMKEYEAAGSLHALRTKQELLERAAAAAKAAADVDRRVVAKAKAKHESKTNRKVS